MILSREGRSLRKLGSLDRAGGYARRVVVITVRDFAKANWVILIFMMALPGAVGFVVSKFTLHSMRARWLYFGAFGVSGVWLVIVFVIIWTGIGNPLMGMEGENRTVLALRKFQKGGWQLVNSLKLHGDWDIDHVLVGPAGVMVLESKWSHKVWPTSGKGYTFMSGRLEDAVRQVNRNSEQFKQFFKDSLIGVTVTPVCVLWSSSYGEIELTPFQTGGCVIVPGPILESWMESLTANWLNSQKVELLSRAIAHQIDIREKSDANRINAPLPTVATMFRKNVLPSIVGLSIVAYSFPLIIKGHGLWFYGISLLAITAIGFFLTKKPSIRRVGQGWLGACLVFIGVSLVVLIRTLIL